MNEKKLSSASFTIEAAVIFPLLLFFMMQFLLLLFTMHDYVVTKSLDYRLALSKEMKKQSEYSYNNHFSDDYAAAFQQATILKKKVSYTIRPELTNTNPQSTLSTYKAQKKFLESQTGGKS